MKLAVFCLPCLFYLTSVDGRIFTRNDLQSTYKKLPANRGKAPQSPVGSLNAARQRPIFARRGQYERQRVHAPKPKVPIAPTSPKVQPKPNNLKCSQLTQSCLPQDGCCDSWASCHCHFFNAICFCRRTNPHHVPGHFRQT